MAFTADRSFYFRSHKRCIVLDQRMFPRLRLGVLHATRAFALVQYRDSPPFLTMVALSVQPWRGKARLWSDAVILRIYIEGYWTP